MTLFNTSIWSARADAAMVAHSIGAQDPLRLMSSARNVASSAQLLASGCNCSCAAPQVTDAFGHASGALQIDPTLVDLTWISIAVASLLVSVAMVISIWLRLHLEVKLFVAAVRCVVQLSVLGYILVPIFDINNIPIVLAYSTFMMLVATAEASGRPSHSYKGLFFAVLLSLGSAASITLTYALIIIIRVHPWYDARYFIPLLGMLLGNTVSGVSVGLATVMEDLSSGKDKVELLLALGATRMEAARSVLQRSLTVALTPILNQLSVVGIVSIPGMLSGQVLSGSPPQTAARYQIVIMFLVTATSALGSTCAVLCTLLTVIDKQHRLRSERLMARTGKPKGLNGFINNQVQAVVDFITAGVVAVAKGVWHLVHPLFKHAPSPPPTAPQPLPPQGAGSDRNVQGQNGSVGADLSRPLLNNSS